MGHAGAFEYDGMEYGIKSDGTVEVVEHWPPYSGDIVIPATVTDGGVTYTVTSVGKRAFADATGLTSVQMPSSLTEVGIEAFAGCTSLTEIVFPSGVSTLGSRVLAQCTNLESVTFPEEITEIPYAACYRDINLSIVVIPDKVTTISGYAFGSCGIKSLTIGRNVDDIISFAFNGCRNINYLEVKNIANWCKLTFLESEQNPLFYARRLWKDGQPVENLVIPEGVEEINPYVFTNMLLSTLTLPESLKRFDLTSFDKSSLKSLTIPDGVTEIAPNTGDLLTLPKLPMLSTVTIGKGVRQIPSNTFYNMESISEINFSEGLVEIRPNAFYKSSVTELRIPNSVERILEAFTDCSRLKKLFFGRKLREIRNGAFRAAKSLEEIHVPLQDPDMIVFSGTGQFGDHYGSSVDKSTCVLYVPRGTAEAYRVHPNWKDFVHIEEEDVIVQGDADGSGLVDVDDLNILINIMLHKNPENVNMEAADANGDGSIDIDDVNILINIMLHKV